MKRFVVYGSRPDGHAKVAMELAEESEDMKCVGLLDDFPENRDRSWRGLKVLGGREDLPTIARDHADVVVFGFSNGAVRADLVDAIEAAGLELPVLIASSGYASPSSTVGAGTQLLWGTRLGPDVVVGPAVLLNTLSVLGHNSRADAGATIGPGVQVCGRCVVETGAQLGASVTLCPDVTVGRGATVGAGAVVLSDVAAGDVVAGVPARSLRS